MLVSRSTTSQVLRPKPMSRTPIQPNSKLDLTGLNYIEDSWLSMECGFRCFEVRAGKASDLEREPLPADRALFTARIDTRDVGMADGLIRKGFALVDTALTFVSAPGSGCDSGEQAPSEGIIVEEGEEEDVDLVEGIAGSAFEHSRFHRDPNFPSVIADRIKQKWARNLVMGHRGTGCLVGRRDNRVVSFLGYLKVDYPRPSFVIDLLAVAGDERGRGAGRTTVGAMQSMAARCARSIIVGTQISNGASVRMYEATGFRLESSAYILHGHTFSSETR